jgi:hypothetical protein
LPQREGEREGINSLMLPETELTLGMLSFLSEEMVFGAKRRHPTVVGLLSDTHGELPVS